jgi:hypothetical protein
MREWKLHVGRSPSQMLCYVMFYDNVLEKDFVDQGDQPSVIWFVM